MAMANWKIAKVKTETGATSSSISFYFKEALKHFQVRLLGFHAKTAMTPLSIREQQVELVDSFKFLGTTIPNTLKRDSNAETIAKKAQQRMFFLHQLKKFRVNKTTLTQFYWAVIESVLKIVKFSITVWFRCASIHNKNMLEGIVKTASKITSSKLPSIESIYTTLTLHKATTLISDSTHPANHLFDALPSRKWFRFIKTRTVVN